MIRKLIPKFLAMLLFITAAATIGLTIHSDDEKKHDALFDHKYVAGDCLAFELRAWDFDKSSRGDEVGQMRVQYVRYTKDGAYYGFRVLTNDKGDWTKPIFNTHDKSSIVTAWSGYIDKFPYFHLFSYTDYVPGSKIMTIRNGMTCRHGWKDE